MMNFIETISISLLCCERLRSGYAGVLNPKCTRRSALTTPPGILSLRPWQSACSLVLALKVILKRLLGGLFVLFTVLLPLEHAWAQDIRDVKAPVAMPLNWLMVSLVLLGLALLGGLVWFLLRRRFSREKTPSPVILPPPWETARKKLKELFAENLPGKGLIKEYYSRLSDIVRQYMEDRFDLRAPEMTTEEFLFSLRTASQLNPAQKEALKDFLTCCDMVKFAKYSSHAQEMVQSFVLAERLINETAGGEQRSET